jgi:hypothetical protein
MTDGEARMLVRQTDDGDPTVIPIFPHDHDDGIVWNAGGGTGHSANSGGGTGHSANSGGGTGHSANSGGGTGHSANGGGSASSFDELTAHPVFSDGSLKTILSSLRYANH